MTENEKASAVQEPETEDLFDVTEAETATADPDDDGHPGAPESPQDEPVVPDEGEPAEAPDDEDSEDVAGDEPDLVDPADPVAAAESILAQGRRLKKLKEEIADLDQRIGWKKDELKELKEEREGSVQQLLREVGELGQMELFPSTAQPRAGSRDRHGGVSVSALATLRTSPLPCAARNDRIRICRWADCGR